MTLCIAPGNDRVVLCGFLAIVVALGIMFVYSLLWGPSSSAEKRIADQIRQREALSDEEAVARLAGTADVPDEFAREFLRALAIHYTVGRRRKLRLGMIRCTDTFEENFVIPFDRLRKKLLKSAKEFNRRSGRKGKSFDAGLFEDFVTSAWFTNVTVSKQAVEDEGFDSQLEDLASNPDLSVATLCKRLHALSQPPPKD